MAASSPFFDLSRLTRLRTLIRDLDPGGAPGAREVVPVGPRQPRRLALFPGSFNPLTNAHVALADRAFASGHVEGLAFLLATRTVDKERPVGASLADRLICLEEFVQGQSQRGVVLVNRGLYVDQAELIRQAMPFLDEVWFVVGSDKIFQIFDHRYYQDRDAALERLFGLASFLVSPRELSRPDELSDFLARPGNRRFAQHVLPLDLPDAYQKLSSTRVREAAARGQIASPDVPPIVSQLIDETGAYLAPARDGAESVDRYAVRDALVEATARGDLGPLPERSFHLLVERLARPNAEGRRRRAALRQGDVATAIRDRDPD